MKKKHGFMAVYWMVNALFVFIVLKNAIEWDLKMAMQVVFALSGIFGFGGVLFGCYFMAKKEDEKNINNHKKSKKDDTRAA